METQIKALKSNDATDTDVITAITGTDVVVAGAQKRALDVAIISGSGGGSGGDGAINDGVDATIKATVTAAKALKVDGSAVTQPVSAVALPLPTGAASAANQTSANTKLDTLHTDLTNVETKQDTGNASLASIDGKLTNPLPVSATALPLPSGAATSAKQDTGNTSLASIDTKLTNPLPVSGPLTDTQLRASAVPVSAAALPLPSGASTSAGQITGNTSLASIDTKLTSPITISGSVTQGTSPWVDNISQFGGSNVVTGTGTSGAGIPRVTISSDSSITNISGTVSLPTGASTSTLQSTGNTSLSSIDGKVANNYGLASGAVRTASQIGNTAGAADFNAGTISAQTLRTVTASDQLNIAVTGSASANNTDIISYDTANNYRSVYFQIVGTFVGTISFQQSSDSFTTTSTAIVLAQNSQSASAVSTATTNGVFIGNVGARYWRARFTAYSSGTATINAVFSPFPYSDIGNAKQVTIGGQPISVVANAVSQGGSVSNNLVPIALGAVTANPTAVTGGQYVRPTADKLGRQVNVIGHVRDLTDTTAEVAITGTGETTLIAQVASVFNDVYSLDVSNTSATVGTRVDIRDTTGGTVIKSFWVPALSTYQFTYNVPLKQSTVNTNWTAQLSAAPTGGDVRISAVSVRNL